MTDRRVVRYYRPRIQIPVETMFSNTGEWALYCLPVDGAQALARIAPYLRREVTYIDELIDNQRYYTPSDSTMESVRDLVGQLEVSLMSGCDFSTIEGWLESISGTLETLAACVCQLPAGLDKLSAQLPDLSEYVTEGLITYEPESEVLGDPTTPATDNEKCELAQAMYYWSFDTFTETLLPFANSTSDQLVAAFVGTTAFTLAISGVGVPVAIVSGVIAALVAWAIDGSIANFTSWMFSARDEIVCIYYNNYPDYSAASAAIKSWIDTQGDISYLDKQVAKQVFGSVWAMTWVAKEQQVNGTWDTYLVSGQCDDCAPIPEGCFSLAPCVLGDWDGGSGSCVGSYRRHESSTSFWTGETWDTTGLTEPWMSVTWLPTGDSDTIARVRLGARRTSDNAAWVEFLTADRPQDVPVTEYFSLSTGLYNNEIEFGIKQEAWYGTPMMVCLHDGDPR